ncbi:DUF998 domain-containing protein [Streptomyces sp. PTM05]|uniref:DUF998 domain-containing protein n=1 Tax=Streptantibioticus parmotrematis TaxID=2873249 RepID=A0ABS7QXG7_9ACTN|nr:DUF998 domain-containing protein [Streptantibioticus parmotrematis]MBY8887055.1 DUF998 domain-containing protein [Streptantibioticus parmotrematis]
MIYRIRRWSLLAVLVNVVFTGLWIAAATWQGSQYNTVKHTISDMYADGVPGAWFLIIPFTLAGAVCILFAGLALWPSLRQAGWPAAVGVTLLALSIFGLGDLLSPFEREGCRMADPGCTATKQLATAGGATDSILSTFGILAFAVSGYFLAVAMRRLPGWARWGVPSMVFSSAFVLVGVIDAVFGSHGLTGFFERVIALMGACGIVALAIGTRRHANQVAPGRYGWQV